MNFRPITFETGAVRAAVLIAATALLSACGQSSVRPDAPGAQSPTTGQPASSAAKSTRRGGAYYKDDGPDDVPPDNLALVPDAVPRLEPLHRFANRPYSVFGKGYVPATELAPFRERGLASWYGRRFHGQPTSSGEPYDMYAMTAAHPTLPIPSYARVTNVATRQSVVVRINDRGPFHDDRVMDLSYTAAFKLGYINRGSAEVEIEQILPAAFDSSSMAKRGDVPAEPVVRKPMPSAPNPAADVAVVRLTQLAAATSGVFLQLGAFSSVDNAEGFRAAIEREMSAFAERLELLADGDRVRLHAGPYASVDEARRVADRIASAMKVKPFVVLR